ncbi:NACHT domain-containing protein [Sinorhizobium meliloti]|uniref:ATP-binding protein n=1 Tax=Rhizobium meliloti TaxID=382 RepID=UPI000FD56C61|nr:ATP-binding protein [Sinorhizobium meliloti]RVJ89056.1 ATP-binding protein [Sinorhizobium meliloti]RVO69322.1 ATP-binding protein [Sinorhizobium meliloti]
MTDSNVSMTLPAPAPPELAGGAGYTFEDAVAAFYLVALLGEESSPGLLHFVVTRVAVQQTTQDEPLDDLVVDGVRVDGMRARLRLQTKRSLTVGAAAGGDFRDIILRAWATMEKLDFREGVDRVGAATGSITESTRRALVEICEWARASESATTFFARFAAKGVAGADRQRVLKVFRDILEGGQSEEIRDEKVFRLLRHFVLVTFDVLHEGAKDEAAAIERLGQCLMPTAVSQAPELWARLLNVSRMAAGRAGELSRPSLIEQLRGAYHLRALPSLANDLAVLHDEGGRSLASIRHEIEGIEIPRANAANAISGILANHRFVRLIGLPGTGKSAALRSFAQRKLEAGNLLFLKSDRLQGSSWASYARSIGVSAAPLETLLFEIGVTGAAALCIDGIDRIETQHQGIILDLVDAILNSPLLMNWTIVATARDNGIEPLRTWLPREVLGGDGVGTVEINGFDDDEAAALADAIPALQPVLFGDDRVREIARRPFFAEVLSRTIARTSNEAAPKSEVELIEEWWRLGGYNAGPQKVQQRQRALIRLAKAGANTLGRRIRLDDVDVDTVADLKTDGILRDVRAGHTVQFSHDIFFEWALLHFLIDQDENWIESMRELGEPPVLGRTVELLSQATLPSDQDWKQTLKQLESVQLRSQWMRAWLLAPLSLPTFLDHAQTFQDAALEPGTNRLRRLVTWFQAERTMANPQILDQSASRDDLTPREVLRIAESLAWPSDVRTWSRFCDWLLANLEKSPASAVPDIVSVFEVWQHLCADIPNAISSRIVAAVAGWLYDIEDREHPEKFTFDRGPWDDVGSSGIKELEERLRNLLLRAARTHEKEIRDYLIRVAKLGRLRHHTYRLIIPWTRILAEKHAHEVVLLALAELRADLPEIEARRQRRSPYGSDFSPHDWQRLAINEHGSDCFPSSPLREPFHSLFEIAPNRALELVRHLTNHAITAWRQLHDVARRNGRRAPIPLPLTLHFPWGEQQFWGGQRAYMWPRGHWANPPIVSGLMALQRWAFAERARGRDMDGILKDVISEHEATAVLNIAVALLLSENHVSTTALPLATSQALWHWDLHRLVNDGAGTNLLGFSKPSDRSSMEAVKQLNEHSPRMMQLKWLAQLFVLSSDEALRTEARKRILAFPDELPFQTENEKEDPDHVAKLRSTAELWAEIGKTENYSAKATEDGSGVLIEHQNPKDADPDVVAKLARGERTNQQFALLNWVLDSLERKAIGPTLSIADAIDNARPRDHAELFLRPHGSADHEGMDHAMEQGAVAGTAAVVLLFAGSLDPEDQAWCRDVLLRASRTKEQRDELWFAGSILLQHPCLFAAKGLAGLIRRGLSDREATEALLTLAGHPLEQVSEEAIASALSLWSCYPALSWVALTLAIQLSTGSHDAPISAYGYDHATEPARVATAIHAAIAALKVGAGSNALPDPPAPWVFAPPRPTDLPYFDDQPGADAAAWRDPDVFLRWDFLPKILKHVPVEEIMADPIRGPLFRDYCYSVLDWMLERINPSWRDADEERREDRALNLFDLRLTFMRLLARVALQTDTEEIQAKILDRIFALNDDTSAAFVEPFADWLCAAGIYDAPVISDRALTALQACMGRVLQHRTWTQARWRDGDIYGHDVPELVRCFLFVTIEYAGGAARFANGDWREIGRVLPVIDPFVRAVGDIPYVASSFLTLCERSVEHYPAEAFVSQVMQLLENQADTPVGWRKSTVPARIAALVHAFAERTQPLPVELAQRMLRILDRLVDMGDRRSAALQQSEIFKAVRV